ncbi:MAG: DUF4149 domain-containing protein [Deltaproteobacteria bacterium]|nr:MAG: DUF4149 domain-containing protein [Deltaproteobacteria bacterium]
MAADDVSGGPSVHPRLRLVADALVVLAVLPWMTSILVSGAVVAPKVFGILGDPARGGEVMQPIFIALGWAYVGLAVLLVLGEILRGISLGWRVLSGVSLLRLPTSALLTVLALWSALVVNPEMKAIRDSGLTRGQGDAWIRFESLHRLAETLATAQLILGALLLLLVFAGAWRRAAAEG